MAHLEHVNITVADPNRTAAVLIDLFGWHIRWEGPAMNGADYTVHVGGDHNYIALYSGVDPEQTVPNVKESYQTLRGLNHVGVVVDDLDAIERKVTSLGFEAHSHADYEPGRRFYFYDADGLEFEVISYA